MGLKVYHRKRKFDKTTEPKGKVQKKGRGLSRFVVQLHRARHLHFDLRLEFDGVFKSWAIPKGPSLNPLDQRLAIFVEDHPLEYGSFEGIIPKGNYGAGVVMIWDSGTYLERNSKNRKETESAMKKNFEKGHITFILNGEKLKGEFALIKLKKDQTQKSWLLVKKRDEYASYKIKKQPKDISIKTGRTMEAIAGESEEAGSVWISKKTKKAKALPLIKKEKRKSSAEMPRRNKPMIPVVHRGDLPKGNWTFEPGISGKRAMAEVEGKKVFLYSKFLLPFEKKFPEIVKSLATFKQNMVLDGEILTVRGKKIYSVFDILFFDGRDLREEPLSIRKSVLAGAFSDNIHVRHTKEIKPKKGLVIAKNLEGPYHSGTSKDWLLVQAGPDLLTAPQKKGTKKSKTKKSLPRSEEVRLTNLDKIFWPSEKITKGDLINYYKQIASYILPYLKDRPESLNRHPNGITRGSFYQKDMTGYIPRWLKTKRIFSEHADRSIDYALCQDERSLLYIVNLGCIEINPWFSRISKLDYPDFLVIDLDPDGNDFSEVVQIAHEFHKILDSIGATNVCKTSGATGIHIGVPTGAKYNFDEVRKFAEEICRIVAKKYPALTSIERNPNRRRNKIYLDFMQNRRGSTLASVFCVRPQPLAPVSMPVTWKELTKGLKPEQFNIKNAVSRIQAFDDPWAAVLGPGIDLKKCLKKLQRLWLKT